MIETWFLGAGLCSRLGLGLGASVEALRRPPAAPAPVESTLGGMTETIPTLFIDETFRTDPAGRFVRLADAAIAEALDASGLSRAQQARASLLLGTSSLDVSIGEHDYASALARGEDVHPLMTNSNMGEMGRRIARRHGLGGPDFTLNTACTASANALAYADALLRTGRAEHVLVVGVELFNRTTAFGFKSLELLSERGMRPFDRNRSGLVLARRAPRWSSDETKARAPSGCVDRRTCATRTAFRRPIRTARPSRRSWRQRSKTQSSRRRTFLR
jgi:3-oxoacyl-[acyl-carrier-protein] synthase I